MIALLRRWYRWATNPVPCHGQLWRLDQIGVVMILHEERRSFEWPALRVCKTGEVLHWHISQVRSQGVLATRLTLADMASMEVP